MTFTPTEPAVDVVAALMELPPEQARRLLALERVTSAMDIRQRALAAHVVALAGKSIADMVDSPADQDETTPTVRTLDLLLDLLLDVDRAPQVLRFASEHLSRGGA